MKIRFNDISYDVEVLKDDGSKSLICFPNGEKKWTPNIDLKRYVSTQKEFEDKTKAFSKKDKRPLRTQCDNKKQNKGIGLEISRN